MYQHRSSFFSRGRHRWLGGVLSLAMLSLPLSAAAESTSREPHGAAMPAGMTHQTPAWAEKLKGQTVVEDAMEGRPDRAAMVDQQHQRVMQHMMNDPTLQQTRG